MLHSLVVLVQCREDWMMTKGITAAEAGLRAHWKVRVIVPGACCTVLPTLSLSLWASSTGLVSRRCRGGRRDLRDDSTRAVAGVLSQTRRCRSLGDTTSHGSRWRRTPTVSWLRVDQGGESGGQARALALISTYGSWDAEKGGTGAPT
jgi:hypothetical protein